LETVSIKRSSSFAVGQPLIACWFRCPVAQVRQQQLGEIGFFEKRLLRKVVASADGRPKEFAQRVGTDEAVEHGLQHVFERNSVAPEHRILEAALIKGRGQLDLAQLKGKLASDHHLVRVGSEYSTQQILNRELCLIRTVNAGIEAVAPVSASRYAFTRLSVFCWYSLSSITSYCASL
jgi:hypothetical protein